MSVYPISYSIPDEMIVRGIPEKKILISPMIPGNRSTYLFKAGQQSQYYDHYQKCWFAYTRRKGGWDCLRHYEIMGNGCIPLFEGLGGCPLDTMTTLPKLILFRAWWLYQHWDESTTIINEYNDLCGKMIEHVSQYNSTTSTARYFLSKFDHLTSKSKVLMINCDPGCNYSRETLTIGLRRELGQNFIEWPRNDRLYAGLDELENDVGFGFTYGGRLAGNDIPESERQNIEQKIKDHHYDLIIYGKVGPDEEYIGSIDGMPFLDVSRSTYSNHELAFLFGGDAPQDLRVPTSHHTNFLHQVEQMGSCFVRELVR